MKCQAVKEPALDSKPKSMRTFKTTAEHDTSQKHQLCSGVGCILSAPK